MWSTSSSGSDSPSASATWSLDAVMGVDGAFESSEGVHHLIARRPYDYGDVLPGLGFRSRDFH